MKSIIQLNIGLDTNDSGALVPRQVIPSLNLLGDIVALRVVNSSTDSKAIAAEIETDLPADTLRAYIHQFAVNLRQDCIAVVEDARGELIGPKAHEWGTFNPDLFVSPHEEPAGPDSAAIKTRLLELLRVSGIKQGSAKASVIEYGYVHGLRLAYGDLPYWVICQSCGRSILD